VGQTPWTVARRTPAAKTAGVTNKLEPGNAGAFAAGAFVPSIVGSVAEKQAALRTRAYAALAASAALADAVSAHVAGTFGINTYDPCRTPCRAAIKVPRAPSEGRRWP